MTAVIKIVISSSSSGSGINDTKRDVQGLGDTASKSGGGFTVLKGVAVNALTAVGSAAIGAVASVGGFVKDAIAGAGDFEAGMNRFSAAAGDSLAAAGLKVEDFKDLFLEIGKELPVSTAEVQEAAITLVKGGLDPAILAAGGLKDAIQFAAAAEMDLADAAELSIKQLATFGPVTGTAAEQTAFLAEAQDLLVKAAGASTLNVDLLGDAMLGAAGAAKGAGLSYEDFVTTMGLISPAFGSAAEAGTSFKNLLARMIPSTEGAKDMMIALGLATDDGTSKFYDANGQFIGMREAAELLKTSFAGLSDAQRTEALNTIFGNDAKGAAIALIGAGAEQYDIFAEKMDAASGVTEAAAARQEGFNTALDNFKGSIEVVQLTIGGLLLPVLTDLLNNVLTPGINTFLTFTEAITSSANPLGTIRTQLEGLIPGIGGVIDALVLIGGAIGVAISWFQQGGMASLRLGTDFWSVYNSTVAVFSGVQNIIGAVLGIVNALITEHGTAILASFTTAWNSVSAMVSAVTTAIHAVVLAIFGQVSTFLHTHGDEIAAFLAQTWAQIASIIDTAAQLVQAIVVPIFRGIASFINSHGSEIQGYLTAAWNIIKALISGTLDTIKGLLQAALAVIRGDWQGAWDAIKGVLQAQLSAGVEIAKNALELLKGAFALSVEAIKSLLGDFASSASSIGASIINGIIDGVKSAAGALADAAVAAVNEALDAAKSAIGFGSPAKKFMPLGFSMPQGMAVGIDRGAPLVADATMRATNAAYAGAASAQTYNQRSFTYSPTINNYGAKPSGALDYAMANSLAGV